MESRCAESGNEIEYQKLLRSYRPFQHRAEKDESIHIEEDMHETSVHEHMGDRLPDPEQRRGRIEQGEGPYHEIFVNQCEYKHYHIDYQYILCYFRDIEHNQNFFSISSGERSDMVFFPPGVYSGFWQAKSASTRRWAS